MIPENNTFEFKSKVWLYDGSAAWYFVTVPTEVSKEIDFFFSDLKRGRGSLPVEVSIGDSTWKTSIFPDKKAGTYLLPLKKSIREKESIKENDEVKIKIVIKP